jgi:hypothetical protein
MHMNASDVLEHLLLLVFSFILLAWGAIAAARPVQLMDFYIRMMSTDGSSARHHKLVSRFLSYKWFYPNMRLCGGLVIAVSFLMMYSALFR